MKAKRESIVMIACGAGIGLTASLLTLFGNPKNMGFCIACFLRDTAGGIGLHRAEAVQYIRPEVIGLVLGAFLMAALRREFRPRGGSSVMTRIALGFFVMIGALMFLGCPFRMILRLAGGDWNAIVGLVGFAAGILAGIPFLRNGYSLKRTYALSAPEGVVFPVTQAALFALLLAAPAFLFFSESGPGSMHAPMLISLAAGLIVGALAQRSRLCMMGGIRDAALFRDWKLLVGFASVLAAALVCNLVLNAAVGGFFQPGFQGQPVAHIDGVWNFLGMLAVGFGSVLLGGCPMRQLVLAGEGNTDSAATVAGLLLGAAVAHNFGLASSATKIADGVVSGGPSLNGKIAVVIGLAVMAAIAVSHTKKSPARSREKEAIA